MASPSASPPLRARMPARVARGDRTLRRGGAASSLHVHADEQPREIEECLAEHGCRPIELLARAGLSRRADDRRPRDARERRRARPARVTAEPRSAPARRPRPTWRRLPPRVRVRHRGIPLCIGSDSNVRIDPLEELRELEGIARRQERSPRRLRHGRPLGDRRPESAHASLGLDASATVTSRPRPPLARTGLLASTSARRSSPAAGDVVVVAD